MGTMLIAIGLLLFAMSAITALPLRIAIELNLSHQPTLNLHIGIIGLQTDFQGRLTNGDNGWIIDISRLHGKQHKIEPKNLAEQAKQFASIAKGSLKAQRKLLKQVRIKNVSLDCRLGTGDAASTALACGLLESTMWALCARAQLLPHISIRPEYQRTALVLTLTGMLSVPMGHIISAAATVALEYGKGRIKSWIKQRKHKLIPATTQSKA